MPKVPVLHQPTLLPCLLVFKIRAVLKNRPSARGTKLLQGKPDWGPCHNPKKPQRSCQGSVFALLPVGTRITSGMRQDKEQELLSVLNLTQCQTKAQSLVRWLERKPASRQKAHAEFRRVYWWAKDVFVRTIPKNNKVNVFKPTEILKDDWKFNWPKYFNFYILLRYPVKLEYKSY